MSDNRIEGYARGLFEIARAEGTIDEVEDELFRFARSFEGSDALRTALSDEQIPPAKRQAIIEDLLGGKATSTTTQLISMVVGSGRTRDLPAIVDPEAARLMAKLYGVDVPPAPRNDIVAVFLTGVEGKNKPANVQPAEMLRINLAVPVTPAESTNPLGVIAGDLGWMRNISDRAAVGGTAHARIGIGDDYARAGVRARYRRWLGRSTSVDLSPGVILANKDDNQLGYQLPGLVASATLNLGDLAALSLEADYGRYSRQVFVPPGVYDRRRFTEVTWRAGWKLGSVPGTISMVPFIAGGILFVMLMGSS